MIFTRSSKVIVSRTTWLYLQIWEHKNVILVYAAKLLQPWSIVLLGNDSEIRHQPTTSSGKVDAFLRFIRVRNIQREFNDRCSMQFMHNWSAAFDGVKSSSNSHSGEDAVFMAYRRHTWPQPLKSFTKTFKVSCYAKWVLYLYIYICWEGVHWVNTYIVTFRSTVVKREWMIEWDR